MIDALEIINRNNSLTSTNQAIILLDIRCPSCGRLLARGTLHDGYLEILCGRCHNLVCIGAQPTDEIRTEKKQIRLVR